MNLKTLLIIFIGSWYLSLPALADDDDDDDGVLSQRISTLEAQVAVLTDLLQYVSVQEGEIDGLAGPHFIIEGANVHIRSGSGVTWDDCLGNENPPGCMWGLGNLIVGYNAAAFDPDGNPIPCIGPDCPTRTGSHNIVLGNRNSFELHSSLIMGARNKALESYAFVAGYLNTVDGRFSSVSGGILNIASNLFSSVSGGWANTASGLASSVSGGDSSHASGDAATISGGFQNEASGLYSSVSGGANNIAGQNWSTVSGGQGNSATGEYSSVSGGANRSATGDEDWVAGNQWEDN